MFKKFQVNAKVLKFGVFAKVSAKDMVIIRTTPSFVFSVIGFRKQIGNLSDRQALFMDFAC
jgi:hypothetical protein